MNKHTAKNLTLLLLLMQIGAFSQKSHRTCPSFEEEVTNSGKRNLQVYCFINTFWPKYLDASLVDTFQSITLEKGAGTNMILTGHTNSAAEFGADNHFVMYMDMDTNYIWQKTFYHATL